MQNLITSRWSQKEYIFNALPADITVALPITCSKVLEDGLAQFPDLIRSFFSSAKCNRCHFLCSSSAFWILISSFNQNYLWNSCRFAFFFKKAYWIPKGINIKWKDFDYSSNGKIYGWQNRLCTHCPAISQLNRKSEGAMGSDCNTGPLLAVT